MLNSMAGADVEESFDRQRAWGLRLLDLKDCLFGKGVEHLTAEQAKRVRDAAERRGLRVHTLSTCLFHRDVEQGERAFRDADMPALDNALRVAEVLAPAQVRLLMARSARRREFLDSSVYLEARHPWVAKVYRQAAAAIRDAGFQAVIENETQDCLFAAPGEIVSFFAMLGDPPPAGLIWDVQNLWQVGTFPTLEVYKALKPVIRMVHLKGGRTDTPGGPLQWQSQLQDASWPVVPIVRRVIEDGASPVLCLNPPHGQAPPEFRYNPRRDVEFLRNAIEGIE